MIKENKYVNEHLVADMIGCSLSSLRKNRHLKKGIPFIKVGRSVRYSIKDVLEYMESNKIEPGKK